jgi:hypothetical protein
VKASTPRNIDNIPTVDAYSRLERWQDLPFMEGHKAH